MFIHKAQFAILCLLIILSVFLPGCSRGKVEEVTIGTIPWPAFTLLRLAEEKGFFEDQGISVKFKPYENVNALHKDYFAGELDGLTGTLSELLLVRERSKRRPQVFLVADFSDGPDMVLAKKKYRTMSSLKGSRVGVDIESLSLYLLARGLEKNGLSLKDIKLVDMTMDKMEEALGKESKDGGVDAIVAYPPVTTSIQKNLDVNKVFTSSEIPGEVLDTITLESDLVQHNREFVEKFVKAYAETVIYLKNHRAETLAYIAKTDKMPETEVAELLDGLKILDVCEQKELFLPSGTLGEAVKTTDLVMRRVGRVTGPDLTVGMITFGPVQAVGEVCP